MNKKKIFTERDKRHGLDILKNTKRLFLLSELFEEINQIESLIEKANNTTDPNEFAIIMMDGLKLQRKGQATWEKRIDEDN